MKRKFSILIVGTVIIGVVFGLVGMTRISQAKPTEQLIKPIPASDIKIVKKLPISEETKGRPVFPPGKDKDYSGTANGVLGTEATGNKYAVVIGICDYPGTTYDICKSDGDSFNMRKALNEKYGFALDNIEWFRDMGGVDYGVPSRDNILNAVIEIKGNLAADDEVMFFFSGHGASGKISDIGYEDTDEAIVVHDNDGVMDADGSADLDFIWDEELRILFSDFLASRVIFVFDSCLAGGMNDVEAGGRIVAMATEETKSAYVYSTGELGEGVFSHYFVNEGMLQGKADKYDHGYRTNPETLGEDVVVEEAFDYAKAHIPPYLKIRQKPVISDNFTDDLLL